jgi:hypothetical protein
MKSINLIKKKFLFKNLNLTKVRKKNPRQPDLFSTLVKNPIECGKQCWSMKQKKSLKNRKKPEQTRANILNPQSIKY